MRSVFSLMMLLMVFFAGLSFGNCSSPPRGSEPSLEDLLTADLDGQPADTVAIILDSMVLDPIGDSAHIRMDLKEEWVGRIYFNHAQGKEVYYKFMTDQTAAQIFDHRYRSQYDQLRERLGIKDALNLVLKIEKADAGGTQLKADELR